MLLEPVYSPSNGTNSGKTAKPEYFYTEVQDDRFKKLNPPHQPQAFFVNQNPCGPFRRDKPAPIELACFDVRFAESWIFQANQYFDAYNVHDEHRLNLVSFYLEGMARDWYQWMYKNHQLIGWEHFTKALVTRFGSKSMEALEGLLGKLQMTSIVAEYLSRFEHLANRTTDASPEMLQHLFISGLPTKIKSDVLSFRPKDIHEAISLAMLQDQKLLAQFKTPTQPTSITKNISLSYPTSQSSQHKSIPSFSPSSSSAQVASLPGIGSVPFEKLSSGHRCSISPQLLLLVTDEDSVEVPPPPDIESSPLESNFTIPTEELSFLAISSQALTGSSHPTALHFTCHIKGLLAQILLNGASTDNFIHPRVAKALKLTVESSPEFSIVVGNDVVLGVAWLATLGRTISDCSKLLFEFKSNRKRMSWFGDPPTSLEQVQPSSLRRFTVTDSISYMYRLELLSPNTYIEKDHPLDLQVILSSYNEVFLAPNSLPPLRPQDHRIPLLPVSSSINVRPYRYPHFQKGEIKRMISKMLHSGVIQYSFSPYSSPVLLVRKKDGTWRFCIDYRALNSITVKDCFPIPTVDELFDELYNARFFSKLDLLAGYHQICVHQDDIEKTTFRTHDGHFEFLVMPFGLSNALSTFQATINSIFNPFLRRASTTFFNLKRALGSVPVLALPDFSKVFSMETDASGTGIGAVLSQEGHPIAFFSQKLSPRMQAASTYTREMFAITQAVQKWRQYLLGRKFIIITDQQPLKSLTSQVIQTPEQQQWLCKLIGYDFEIVYRLGKLNSAADALSRKPALMALSQKKLWLTNSSI
ncbi:uncharacterized protein LOC124899586 [Capsicum annuum]|uniref:uncharacterized protein LOC124899586 n=1 Tax=Capsicum annuum TaxID=4072 RepID=UPI001FB12788|nr:uncharacterized protein LOC124899586 [Capsicum annuum]